MKRALCLVALCFVVTRFSHAASCASGSLATYISLGSAGCTIGGNTYFNFQDLAGSFGATQLDPSAVNITPSGGNYNPAITAVVNVSATAPNAYETMFTYSVTGLTYVSETMTLSGSSETGDGDVTDTINYCEGGPFGPDGVDGCAGITGGTNLIDGAINRDMFTFDPPYFLSLTYDLVIDGGTAGTAMGATINDSLSATPEPAPVCLAAVGLFLVVTLKPRFSRRG